MTITPRDWRDYKSFRDQGMPASRARQTLQHVRDVRAFEQDHVTEVGESSYVITVDGVVYSVTVERDEVTGPRDFDCYEDDDVAAYDNGNWSYVHITVSVTVDGFKGTDSLGGVDVGDHWQTVSRLDTAQQIIAAVLDNEMLDSACHAALRARAESDRDYIRRQIAKIRNGEDDDSYRLKITSDKGSTKWLTISRDQLFSIGHVLGIDAKESE